MTTIHQGPPTCLQITVYEKKFMSEIELGGADVNLESLGSGGQIEEWVPLRAGKDGITWYVHGCIKHTQYHFSGSMLTFYYLPLLLPTGSLAFEFLSVSNFFA